MKITSKRLASSVLACVAAVVIVIQALNFLAGQHRELVHQELQKYLGKDATFGTLEVSLRTGLGFTAKEFRIADNPRFGATPLLRARELKLGVSWIQLLLGRVVINSLSLEAPEFQIITDETGLLNLAELSGRRKEIAVPPRSRAASQERKSTGVIFQVSKVSLRNGTVAFVDRSVKEPAEMQIRNIEIEAAGLDPTAPTSIMLAAALNEGLGQDIKIEGTLGPLADDADWSHQPVDLQIRCDSLYVPLLARALPLLRDIIPRELAITGPSSLQARFSGNFQQPRITDLTLKVPLFASSDYNAIVTGNLELPEGGSWDRAQMKGKLTLSPINLSQLRTLPILSQTLPSTLVMDGPVSIYSQFEGSWENLRIGALIKAEKSEIRYRDWVRKSAGSRADLRLGISRQKHGFVFHESVLNLGNAKMTLSGSYIASEPRLQLRLRTGAGQLAAWGHLLSPLSFYGVGGKVDWDVILERSFSAAEAPWSVRGQLNLVNSEFRDKQTGKKVDEFSAQVSFRGQQAHAEKVLFRLGSSRFILSADIADITQPTASFTARSAELSPMDLPAFPAGYSDRLKNVDAVGEIRLQNGDPMLRGVVTSTEGSLHEIPYHNLRADIAWSPTGVICNSLSLQALNGKVQSNGFWAVGSGGSRFELASRVDSAEMRELVMWLIPQLTKHIDGRINARGQFSSMPPEGVSLQNALTGSGEATVQNGTLGDFNPVAYLFLGSGSRPDLAKVSSRMPKALMALISREQGSFDTLKANFAVEEQRIRTDNLVFSAPDFTITGAGWVGFDYSTKWNGLLVFSPRIVQEMQHDFKAVRYLLDRRGRLSIAFRVEGTVPNVRIRPENRALAQALGWHSLPRGNDSAVDGESGDGKKEKGGWLPESLDQFLKR
jgi:hypothetical protein